MNDRVGAKPMAASKAACMMRTTVYASSSPSSVPGLSAQSQRSSKPLGQMQERCKTYWEDYSYGLSNSARLDFFVFQDRKETVHSCVQLHEWRAPWPRWLGTPRLLGSCPPGLLPSLLHLTTAPSRRRERFIPPHPDSYSQPKWKHRRGACFLCWLGPRSHGDPRAPADA